MLFQINLGNLTRITGVTFTAVSTIASDVTINVTFQYALDTIRYQTITVSVYLAISANHTTIFKN